MTQFIPSRTFLRDAPLLLALLLASGTIRAADAEAPYQLDVVLDMARHRLLTNVFKEQVRRELQDSLQSAYGPLANVQMLDKHPRLDEVRRDGLGVLDKWGPSAGGRKTHFVFIDYTAGEYEIQTRQHDGLTGVASPVIRREHTADRPIVARLAALMIDRDFGIIGSFKPGGTPGNIVLELRGQETGAPLERWVHKGDLFAIVPVIGSRVGSPYKAHLLQDKSRILQVQAQPEQGRCKCALLGDAQILKRKSGEFRCIRLQTIRAPLHVRVVKEGAGSASAANMSVTVRRTGFEKDDLVKLVELTDDSGYLSTERHREGGIFDRVAFLTVNLNAQRYNYPIALVDDRPVSVVLPARAFARGKQLVEIEKTLWEEQAYESGTVQQELFHELKEMEKKPEKRREALELAKKGLAASKETRKQLGSEREDLKSKLATLDTSYGDQWLRFLDTGHLKLEAYIADQERIFKDENDPKRQEFLAKAQQGKLEEARAEYGKALELYKEAIDLGFNDAKLRKHFEELSAKWKPRGEQHRIARAFIYDDWAGLNLVKQPGALRKTAKEAFEQCRAAGDTLTPQKLLQGIIGHAGKLQEEKKKLEPNINEEDQRTLELIADLAGQLKTFGTEVQAYLQEKGEK
jgi:hypothetical protein